MKSGGQEWVVGGERSEDAFARQVPLEDKFQVTDSPPVVDTVQFALRDGWHRLQARVMGALDHLLQQTSTPSLDIDTKGQSRLHGKFFYYIRDSFQTGLLVGLTLGCLSLVLFHQMNGTTAVQNSTIQTATTSSYTNYGATPMGITVPGVRLFALEDGPFTTLTSANAEAAKIAKLGIATTVHSVHPVSGQTSYALLADVSIYATDLDGVKNRLRKLGVPAKVTLLSWNARAVPIQSFAQNRTLADSVSHWLAADVSALTTLTASLSDGVAARDATTAFKYSASIQPSRSEIASLQQNSTYLSLGTLTEQAFAKAALGQRDAAMHLVLDAYEQVHSLLRTMKSN